MYSGPLLHVSKAVAFSVYSAHFPSCSFGLFGTLGKVAGIHPSQHPSRGLGLQVPKLKVGCYM